MKFISTIIRTSQKGILEGFILLLMSDDDDDVYLDELQTRGVKKSILYM
jgi:hypothetical protein